MSFAFNLPLVAIARYMRMGLQVPEGALAERVWDLREQALKVFRPARIWRRVALPLPVESQALARHLVGCPDAYLVCGTIGAEFDTLQRRVAVTSGADALIVQAIGTAAIEEWMDAVEGEIRQELEPGKGLVRRFSPGYGDLPLDYQRTLLTILDTPRKIGVSITDTLLMVPSKSVSAIVGVKVR
jgi:hypothetical protein